HYVLGNLPLIIGVALFIVVLKALLTTGVLLPFHLGGKTVAFTALGMISIGEFSYVLAQAGLSSKAITPELYNLIVASSLVTIFLTPGAFWIAPRVDKKLATFPALGKFFAPVQRTKINRDFLESPHAIVLGYGRVGRRI